MKKVFLMAAVATLALTGIVSAEEMAAKNAVAPVVKNATAPYVEVVAPVALNNTACPVCGMEIPADMLGKNTVELKGKIINVCSPDDKVTVLTDPEKYLKAAEKSVMKKEEAPVPAATM